MAGRLRVGSQCLPPLPPPTKARCPVHLRPATDGIVASTPRLLLRPTPRLPPLAEAAPLPSAGAQIPLRGSRPYKNATALLELQQNLAKAVLWVKSKAFLVGGSPKTLPPSLNKSLPPSILVLSEIYYGRTHGPTRQGATAVLSIRRRRRDW